uniref:FA complementation group D2 n=1 Tax=Astatotilapia calliptera TaxID=8154 RepID=A0AAX7VQZ7_ASTCA
PHTHRLSHTDHAGRQSKEAAPEETSQCVFVDFVRVAGVTLRQGGMPNEIGVDQVVFQRRIQQQIQKSPRYPGIIQEFITALESYMENTDRFRNCLLPCIPQSSNRDSSSVSSFQESLLRMLLGIEITSNGGVSIPRIIINQLKWLDRVVDTKDLASKLMELVSIAPAEVQCDIITSLPEILEDSQHNDIARELNSLLQEKTQLTVPILDALSSLNLVRGAVMATLAAVQLEDLPVVVKFILHSVSASDAYEVVCNLRKKLELEQCVLPPVLQVSQSRMNSKAPGGSASAAAAGSSQDSISLILDCIKSAVRFQKTISEAWIKVMDLLVLLILHSTNANQSRRGAERVLKVKVRNGLIQEALLQRTFRDYAQVMRGYFPSTLALAQSLVRSPDPCVVPFGGNMYLHAFTAFDSYCHQEVVGSLVTHVCSGVGGEVDVALELLCGLVNEKPSEMAMYAVFVKGILDYMDNLTPQQIRRLFHLLSKLAFGQKQGSHIQDDMHIVIRKQLSSTVPKYKRIGIIGAVMIVGSMGYFFFPLKSVTDLQLCLFFPLQVTALLELVKSSSESSPEAAALYYDELANLILSSTLDPQVQVCFRNSQKPALFFVFLFFFRSFPFPARAMYKLYEDEEQGGIAINLMPLLAKDIQNKGDLRVSSLCLSPFFRLLRLCVEKRHQGDLEEIDGLLGCPLILTDMDVVEKVESLSKAEREFLCTLLFHTINWFREVVNAFCTQKDTDMKMRVLTRLQNITYFQTLLERALAGTPGYVPPIANFDGDSTDGIVPNSTVPVNKIKKDGTGKKRKASGKNSSESSSQPEKEKVKEIRPGVSLASYRPFFRELDMEVLSVLQCGLLSRSLLDSELHTKVREEVLLGPAELVFLLEDMLRKLEFSLTAAPAKRAPFLKVWKKSVGFSHLQQRSSKDIASCCVQLMPALCSHLENCHNHFQIMLSENNGETTFLIFVFHNIINAFVFSVLFFRHSFEYLLNFRSTVPNLSIALCLSQLLSTVSEKGGNPAAYREQTASLARRFLNQDWVTASGEKERGTKFNEALHTLLSIYLEHVDDILKAVEEIAAQGIPELINASKDESSASWPTLSRQTFLVFYKVLMAELEKAVRKIPAQSEKLLTWNLAVRDFHILVNLVKTILSQGSFPMLFSAKKSLYISTYWKIFVHEPVIDMAMLVSFKEDVQSLLKTFQLSTRQLHHMCGHSKMHQDTSLTNHVPALKKSLELFVYRVKAMLTLNNCQEAFWMGNLKNRNLKGEEILSQRSQEEDDDEEEEEQPERSPPPQEQSEDEVIVISCKR